MHLEAWYQRFFLPINCPIGAYSGVVDSLNACIDCPVGEYQDQSNQNSCKQCPTGSYQDQTGQTSCSYCPSGTYQNLEGQISVSSCLECAAGSYQDQTGQAQCSLCPRGYFEGDTGQSVFCSSYCWAGSYGADEGAVDNSTCLTCSPGTYASVAAPSCAGCPRGKYEEKYGQAFCTGFCPMDTTTDNTGSVNITDCKSCPYPFKTNHEGSDGCPGIFIDLKYSGYVIWGGLTFLFLYELLYACYYDLSLVISALTFGELIITTSTFDFTSDIYFVLNEQFYNEYLFGLMVASLGISLFIFPGVLIRQKLAPAMTGDKINQYFPGYVFLSSKIFFITFIDGYIAIDQQIIFRRPNRDDLVSFSISKLRGYMASFDLLQIDATTHIIPTKEEMIESLDAYYASGKWNPVLGGLNDDALYKVVLYWLFLVPLLYTLQFINIILFVLWPLIMFLRLPFVLFLMIFHSSTKSLALRRRYFQ